MMDHLDAHQVARLECLKLLAPAMRGKPLAENLGAVEALARFVLDGEVPAVGEDAGE